MNNVNVTGFGFSVIGVVSNVSSSASPAGATDVCAVVWVVGAAVVAWAGVVVFCSVVWLLLGAHPKKEVSDNAKIKKQTQIN